MRRKFRTDEWERRKEELEWEIRGEENGAEGRDN